MKHVKMLGLLAVAAAALMAFAGPASADEVTSDGTQFTGVIQATSTNSSLKTSLVTVTCKHSSIAADVTSQGAGKTVEAHVDTLDFAECNHTVTVKQNGTLSLHVNATNTGTLTSSGAEITVLTHGALVGTTHCIYTTNFTDIGAVTGGTEAKLHATSEEIDRQVTDFPCSTEAFWNGDYTVSTPHELHLDDN